MKYIDLQADSEPFMSAVLQGLRGLPKAIPPKYFYDQQGSMFFEEICKQPEYYPTRTETAILRSCVDEISEHFPEDGLLIELGSGASVKTEILLDKLYKDKLHGERKIRAYLPFDISKEFLLDSATRLRARYPGLKILPICGDFTAEIRMPESTRARAQGRMAFLPGSTLGNFDPSEALGILKSVRKFAGRFLIGIDLEKDPELLEAAYNDAAGVTAQFNKNLLSRLGREGGVEVDPDDFAHEAFYRKPRDPIGQAAGRIEMHLVARKRVRLRVADEEFRFLPGESIHTENSYKYTPEGFEALSRRADFEISERWTDPDGWFGVFLLLRKT